MSSSWFSKTHGHNVSLDKNHSVATWNMKDSGGWAYSACALEKGQTVVAVVDGSGHCELGLIKTNPGLASRIPSFRQLNEIRFHRRKCCIPIQLNESGTEVISCYEGRSFTYKVDKQVWVALYVKFGDITLQLVPNGSSAVCFCKTHGKNIKLSDDDKKATTISKNPYATCFLRDKVTRGETVFLKCSPIKDGDRDPSRYHLNILVASKDPEQLKGQLKSPGDRSVSSQSDQALKSLEVLDKDNCNGIITVKLVDSTNIEYPFHGKQNTQKLDFDASDGCWIGLELYRVFVTVTDKSVQLPVSTLGQDVADGFVRNPSNVTAENSIDPLNSYNEQRRPKRSDSSYASVTEVKQLHKQAPTPYTDTTEVTRNTFDNLNIDMRDTNNTNVAQASFSNRNADMNNINKPKVAQATSANRNVDISDTNNTNVTQYVVGNADFDRRNNDTFYVTQTSVDASDISMRLERIEKKLEDVSKHVMGVQPEPSSPPDLPSGNDDKVNMNFQPNWVKLVEDMRADRLVDHLFQHAIISENDMLQVHTVYTKNGDHQEANRKLLSTLQKKKVQKALMLDILEKAEETHLKEYFFPE